MLIVRMGSAVFFGMKPHPRIRKGIKWGGVVVTLLLTMIWIESTWWCAVCRVWSDVGIGVVSGQIRAVRSRNISIRSALYRAPVGEPFEWSCRYILPNRIDKYRFWMIFFPIWPLILVVAVVTLIAWRSEILADRDGVNLCSKCRYNRAGIAGDARCPECGASGEMESADGP
jgi:hypothetical protein